MPASGFLLSITSADHTIRLSSSSFVPNDVAIGSFIEAMQRGVKAPIIRPSPYIDSEAVRKASRAKWGPLLQAGAEIDEYQPTTHHVKLMIVDDFLVSAGSTNFDDRSFRLNDEANFNLNIYDHSFALAQVATFDSDRAKAKRIMLEAWLARPWRERVMERSRRCPTRSCDPRRAYFAVSGNGTGLSAGEFSSPKLSSIATVT